MKRIIVCNAEGVIYADSVGGSTKGISVKDRSYFQDAKANKINVSSSGKIQKNRKSGSSHLRSDFLSYRAVHGRPGNYPQNRFSV